MKKEMLLPVTAVLGGAAAFVLRLIQNRTGFEASTGLPIPGTPAALALIALLLALTAALFCLSRRIPGEKHGSAVFPDDFSTTDPAALALPVMGIFLIALAGLADVAEAMGAGNLISAMQSAASGGLDPAAAMQGPFLSGRMQLILGLLSLLSAACLFLAAVTCKKAPLSRPQPTEVFLSVPPVALVIRLVMMYRLDSVNPSLQEYYVTLLALVFLTLGFYRLSSFAFRAGNDRAFALYAGLSAVFSLAALADGGPYLSSLLLYLGGALTLLGFLLLSTGKIRRNETFS